MLKWIGRIFCLLVVVYLGLLAYSYYRQGLFSMPDMPDGAYFVSFENGLRGIVLEADVRASSSGDGPKFLRSLHIENRDRKYLGVPADVPPWFVDSWSICQAPTEEERVGINDSLPNELRRNLRNARLEAVCMIDVDGKEIFRGVIFSVPRL